MLDVLQKEEKRIVNVLSRYYCLSGEQLKAYIPKKSPEVAQRILNSLANRQLILESGVADLYVIDPRSEHDEKMLYAFWVFLLFAGKVQPNEHYAANFPGQIFFLRDMKQYEIVVIRPGDEYLLGQLDMTTAVCDEPEEQDKINFIIVIFDAKQMPRVRDYMEGTKSMVALLNAKGPFEKPEVKFAKV